MASLTAQFNNSALWTQCDFLLLFANPHQCLGIVSILSVGSLNVDILLR